MAPHIPDELLVQIFSCLVRWNHVHFTSVNHDFLERLDKKGQRTLVNICTASKRFCYLAQPVLYSAFEKPKNPRRLRLEARGEPAESTAQQDSRVIRSHYDPTTRSSCSSQDFAARSLNSNVYSPIHDDPRPSSQFSKQLRGAASAVPPEGEEDQSRRLEWFDALDMGDEDAQVTLLLALLPNLEKLQMGLQDCSCSFFDVHLLSWTRTERLFLSKLETLEVRNHQNVFHEGMSMGRLSNLLELPHLKTLQCGGILVTPDIDVNGWLCSASGIQNLCLKSGTMGSASIAVVLRSCASLRSFGGVFGYMEVVDLPFKWPELSEALDHHCTSLESLTVDIGDECNVTTDTPIEVAQPLTSMKKFVALRHLKVSQSGLIGIDAGLDEFAFIAMLPPSLQTLVVFQATAAMEPYLRELAIQRRQFPELQKVEYHARDIPRADLTDEDGLTNMVQMGKLAQVGLMFKTLGVRWETVWPVE